MLSTTRDSYTGYYYELSNGKKFTGKTPTSRNENILLENISIPLDPNINPDNPPLSVFTEYQFSYSTPDAVSNLYTPQFNTPLPTKDDYISGNFTRYFCKKTNELRYLEITQQTYTKLIGKSNDILWSLYTPFKIPWKITENSLLNYQINEQKTQEIVRKLNLDRFVEALRINYSQYTPTTTQTTTPSTSITNNGGTSGGGVSSGGTSGGGGY